MRRWTLRDVVAVAGVQAVGFVVAFLGFLYAFPSLPAEGFFGEDNSAVRRATGAAAATFCVLGLVSGCMEAWRRHRSRMALVLAKVVLVVGATVSVAWALQLNLG